MRLLRADTEELKLEDVPDGTRKYAVLSHRWLPPHEEVTYADITSNKNSLQAKKGWSKLNWCRQQAVKDGLQYIWADTACIDKSSSQELTESINAMYRWYKEAEFCYVYLQDMPDPELPEQIHSQDETSEGFRNNSREIGKFTFPRDVSLNAEIPVTEQYRSPTEHTPLLQRSDEIAHLEANLGAVNISASLTSAVMPVNRPSKILDRWDHSAFAKSEWFTRAWTLQEMIAPEVVRFYNKSWILIGELLDLAADVSSITGVHMDVLTKTRPLSSYSIAQKMSWAAMRKCTKVEDRAYSLLGLMNVSLGIIYGEGERAFLRLQEELLRVSSSDDSIFAFSVAREEADIEESESLAATALLAESPNAFSGCGNIALATWRMSGNQHHTAVKEIVFHMRAKTQRPSWWARLKFRLFKTPIIIRRQAILDCSLENRPSTIMKLNLFAIPSRPNTFYVRSGCRITMEKLLVEGNDACPYESFSVVRNPEEGQTDWSPANALILCHCKSSRLSLNFVHSSIPHAWYEADETFSIPSKRCEFEAELEVCVDGSQVTTLQLVNGRHEFSANLDSGLLPLNSKSLHERRPGFCGLLLSWKPPECAIKRAKHGFIIVKAMSSKTYLGHFDALVVEVRHVGVHGFVLFILFRIILHILAVVAVLLQVFVGWLGLLACLLPVPQPIIIFGLFWFYGMISWWVYLLIWTFFAIVWIVIFSAATHEDFIGEVCCGM